MNYYDVPGYDRPLFLSEEHAELIGGKLHEVTATQPSRNATRAEWADYALAQGADPASVDTMTRTQLIDTFGS